MGRTQTVEVTSPVIDLNDLENSYNPNSILEEIKEKYGGGEDYSLTYIHLSRFDEKDRTWKTLRSDFTALPAEDDIRLQYGGGKYRLLINFKVAGDNKRRVAPPQYFIFEGDAIPVVYNPEKTNGNTSMDVPTIEDRVISRLKAELPNLNGNQQKDDSMKYVIEQMREDAKTNREILLEMVKSSRSGSNDNGIDKTLVQTLLTTALNKSTGELETFSKFAKMYKDLSGDKTDGGFDWGSLINSPLGQTVAMKLMGGGKPAGPVAGLPPGNANPMDAINQILQGVQSLQAAVTNIDKRLIEVEKIAYEDDPEPGASEVDPEELVNVHNLENKTNGNFQNKNNDDMFGENFQNALGEQLRNADVPTKIATLLDFNSKGMELKQMFEWCVAHKALEAATIEPYNEAAALTEFNGYMKQAGLNEIVL